MEERTLETTRRERAEAWLFIGPAGRVISFSADMALAVPLLLAHGARQAFNRLRRGSTGR